MTKLSRGRPRGSSPNRKTDDPILRRAAMRLVTGRARTPTEAFRDIVGDDNTALIRRLQRRWSDEGQQFLAELPRLWQKQRWDMEAVALEQAAPELFSRVRSFAQSSGGREALTELGIEPDGPSLMSLGIMKLWELLQERQPVGAAAADHAFSEAMSQWSRFGVQPDGAFMRRFAELCLAIADDEMSAEKAKVPFLPTSGGAS